MPLQEDHKMNELESAIKIDTESVSVQTHLSMLQNIIQRMASNSVACKTWCITLVSAILVMVVDKGKENYIYLGLFPIMIFAVLDLYYLGLERAFKDAYDQFIYKLHSNILVIDDLYMIKPTDRNSCSLMKCGASPSIWIFYLSLFVLVLVMKWIVF